MPDTTLTSAQMRVLRFPRLSATPPAAPEANVILASQQLAAALSRGAQGRPDVILASRQLAAASSRGAQDRPDVILASGSLAARLRSLEPVDCLRGQFRV
jgi:hypothetical protein